MVKNQGRERQGPRHRMKKKNEENLKQKKNQRNQHTKYIKSKSRVYTKTTKKRNN